MASPARGSLKAFLGTARKALTAPPTQRQNPLTFVIGNESADLDSLCSAVLFAYLRTQTPPHTLHIPLSNLPRADLALRPELGAVLRPAGLQPDDLLTLSDLPKHDLRPENTRWFLVDHNSPTGLASQFCSPSPSDLLIGCIDHHEDEGTIPSSASPRVFAKCGSCTSLVIDHCRSTWDSVPSYPFPNDEPSISTQLAHLALGPILIDTNNLTSKDKTTPLDVNAVEFAESKIQPSAGYNRTAYFEEITRLKEDISTLSYRDVLRKDYKRWTEGGLVLGISSVVQGVGYLVTEHGKREEFLGEMRKWAGEQELDIAAVMTVSRPEGRFTREFLVWAFGEAAVRVVREFVRRDGEKLGLEAWRGGEMDEAAEGAWRMCWTQRGLEHSRKQVAPMLREAMKEGAKL
ncbi:exopolyphosphatase [Podospora aff. communis PSN243]|uniref:Exopolyphosphatase n=1 Tax=Podospora aff. communis PSN243 TaxID=3040156 RepID=A0AAV9H2J0_9PEZI|nr:exopolyphosphatase [Podospora aff. communis PSN243]